MKIYVAGSWKDRSRIKTSWIIPLSKHYTITHDWTVMESSSERTIEHQKKCATADIKGVKDADALVVVMDNHISNDYHYRGTNFEMGIAINKGIPIFLFNPWHDKNSDNLETFGSLGSNVFYFADGIKHYANAYELLRDLREYSLSIKNSKIVEDEY